MQNTSQNSGFFLSLLENSTDLISIIDAEGRYRFVAGSVKSMLGYAPEEMVGLCAFGYIHEDDRAGTAAALCDALDREVSLLPHFRFRTKQGGWRWIECTVTNMVQNPHIQGYVTNSRDVTARVEEEERKKKSQAHYESLFYNHPDAVFELDREGFFCRINRHVSAITGYGDAQVLNAHFRELVHADHLPAATEAFARALKGHAQRLELSIVKQGGEVAFLSVTAVPVLLEGEVVSIQGIAQDVTVHRKYEAYVREQAELLSSIMERIPESFFSLDRNWRLTYVNAFFAGSLGRSKEELIGKSIRDLLLPALWARLHIELQRVVQTGMVSSFEEHLPHENGSTLVFQAFQTGKGVSVHFMDVTDKKREQDRLEKLSLVASKTATCVMIMDNEGRVEWVNEAFERFTGYSLGACYQQHPLQFLAGGETQEKALSKIRRKMESRKAFRGEVLCYTRAGQKVWVNLEITPVFGDDGKLSKFVSVGTDVTDRKAKEEQLLQVTGDLFRQNRDLQQFSYMVSHNLRAPAANLMGLADILCLMEKNSSLFGETLERIQVSARMLDTVIRDINQILAIRENSRSLSIEEVNLSEVCQEAIARLEYKLSGCRHTVNADLDKSVTLLSNRVYVFEIVKNLLSNAIKFRKEGEVLRLDVRVVGQGDKAELVVKDNGIGLDAKAVRNDLYGLYKRFHRGYPGRGIGLFLVKAYVDTLGGSIKVKSEPAKGATFRVKFTGAGARGTRA